MEEAINVVLEAKNGWTPVSEISSDPLKSTGPIVKSMHHGMKNCFIPIVKLPHVPVFFGLGKMSVRKHEILLWCNFFLYKDPPDRRLKNGSTFDSLVSMINGLTPKVKNT